MVNQKGLLMAEDISTEGNTMKYITAKTFPIDENIFQSEPAEFAYTNEGERLGLTREQLRPILVAYQFKQDESERRYQELLKRKEEITYAD